MKSITLLFLATTFVMMATACGQNYYDDNYTEDSYQSYDAQFVSNQNYAAEANDDLEMKAMKDPKTGRVMSYLPLPKSWKVVPDGTNTPGLEAPNGIKVNSLPPEIYYFNVDPYVAQMAGKAVANPIPVESVFQQHLAPAIQQQGGKLIKQYPLQQIAQRNQQLLQGALNRMRLQSYTIIASEWQQANGKKSLILLSHMVGNAQGSGSWSISITELEAPAAYFDKAKETYLYAQANWQLDRNTVMAHRNDLKRMDRQAQQRMAASQAAHNARMRSNQAAYNSFQKTQSTLSDIGDIYHQGYQNRSAMTDQGQANAVDGIWGRQTVTNPYNNQQVQMEHGYNNYYINSDNEYIGTDDMFYDPNMDNTVNHQEWQRIENAGGGY